LNNDYGDSQETREHSSVGTIFERVQDYFRKEDTKDIVRSKKEKYEYKCNFSEIRKFGLTTTDECRGSTPESPGLPE